MVNKIIDCFTFYNELKILKFRLEYLYDHVDYFILVEGTLSHAGKPKELFYQNNKDQFEKYKNKIIHVIVSDMKTVEEAPDAWVRENYQRNCIDKGIKELNLNDNDIIHISDADEIPDKKILIHFRYNELNNNSRIQLLQDSYWYNLNCRGKKKWDSARIVNYHTYINVFNRISQDIRLKYLQTINTYHIEKGGWHFTWQGDIKFLINKLENFAHQEYNKDIYKNEETINDLIKKNLCFIDLGENNRDGGYKYLAFEENDYLPENYQMLI
jgi:beta-1,4-mannosyl-glycoprotein beta-1,4-N-acetylglucosaminyltransferase